MTALTPRFPASIRSLLCVQGDDMPAIEAALGGAADALLIDLAFGPAPARSGVARTILRSLADRLGHRPRRPLYFRVGDFSCGRTDADLDAAILVRPDGITLSRASGEADLGRLASHLSVREALHGIVDGTTGIIAALDTSAGLLRAGEVANASLRLAGVSWDAEATASELAVSHSEPDRSRYGPVAFARNLCLFAAAAARRPAIDAASGQTDPDLFQEACASARCDGFAAKIAIDAEQVAIINATFARR